MRYDGERSTAKAMERFRTQERVSYRLKIRRVASGSALESKNAAASRRLH